MKKKHVSIEKTLESNEAFSFLEDMVNSLKVGKIVVEKEGKFVTLTPPENIDVKIEASQKKNKERIKFKLSWKVEEVEEPVEEETITISSNEPPVVL